MTNIKNIRNFCIIAHIDHGKSTLADRFIQKSKIIADRDFKDQILDNMDIERERGITIKSQVCSIPYTSLDGTKYELNLVDTPGHVDFTYEVSRAIASCEGALLLVDCTQGVQAQTLSNLYLAMEHDLTIIPVINKIDMQGADIPGTRHQIDHDLGLDSSMAVEVSAKMGIGVDDLLESIVKNIPAPAEAAGVPPQALVFDSHYDPYRGVVIHFRVFNGKFRQGQQIRFFASQAAYTIEEIGKFRIGFEKGTELGPGEVGYILAGIRQISDIRVGDTVTDHQNPCQSALPGFKDVKPVVFSSVYPVDANDYEELVKAMEKLKLNDAALVYEKDSSAALGYGFKCGFLGLLHLEVVQERLEREFDLSVVLTAPSVRYQIYLKDGSQLTIETPQDFPDVTRIEASHEPYIKASIITPKEYLGNLMTLVLEKRGVQKDMRYLDEKRVELIYELPMAEVLYDFYDRLKSLSRGYASFDYEIIDYRETELVKLDILLNHKPVDALSQLVFRGTAEQRARSICKKLKEEIPRHQFLIPIQGSIGSTIIARETISALRKDVTAKCYGGDISRKRKLLEKQKEGKKRMKMVGNVELPQSAFLSVLKTSEE
jgi:GTP-binding protein LepA